MFPHFQVRIDISVALSLSRPDEDVRVFVLLVSKRLHLRTSLLVALAGCD
jgi:hypothetical protein